MYRKILFAVDINDVMSWKNSIPKVVSFCENVPDCELVVMYVVQTYGLGSMEEYFPKNWATEAARKARDQLSEIVKKHFPAEIKTKQVVKKGVVYKTIIDQAESMEVDVVIMSAHHPERSDYLLGPNVAKVVRHASMSVLVVRD